MTDADARFDALQSRLVELWPVIRSWSDAEQTVVVVPSYALDEQVLETVEVLLPAYEERFLYLLLLLRQPRCKVVFVTSRPVPSELVDYWLALVPGVAASDARSRLVMLDAGDPSPRPLGDKVLERPQLVERIRAEIDGPAHLTMFNVAEAERDLALLLDVPIYGSAPRFAPCGTKSGARGIFADLGIPHPRGEDVRRLQDITAAVVRLGSRHAVAKLDHGVSGLGNVVVAAEDAERIVELVPEGFAEELSAHGGVVEELLEADDLRSPSVQLRVTPTGDLEVISTHDQILGGPAGQTFAGCRLPADPAYARTITELAASVGRRLAGEGVMGRLAVDFVAVPGRDGWASYAIEINLRKGGTTHPYNTLQFLTDGRYDPSDGVYRTADGEERCYVASDALGDDSLCGLRGPDLIAGVRAEGIGYDAGSSSGVVLQMTSALRAAGKYGATAIAATAAEAEALMAEVERLAARLGDRAVRG